MNQCDGCLRGLPVVNGIHRGDGYDVIACTANRYQTKKCEYCETQIPVEDDLCPNCWDNWDGMTVEEILKK